MPKAFVMVDIAPGQEAAVQQAVGKMANVQMAYQVTGEHDLVAFVDAEPYEEFAVILEGIRKLAGVRDTDTYLVLH